MNRTEPHRKIDLGDIKNPNLIVFKGFLFLLLGVLSSLILLLEHPSLRIALLLAITVWSFARFYYFAFYVIEHYIDPGYRFAGLGSFVQYLWHRRSSRQSRQDGDEKQHEK